MSELLYRYRTAKEIEVDMDSLLIALTLSGRANAQEAWSALPNAPVVTHVDRVPAFQRTRKAVVGALCHLADVVAPPLPVGHAPGRLTLSAGNESGGARWDESRCRPSPTTSA
jgi:hypothetical protein